MRHQHDPASSASLASTLIVDTRSSRPPRSRPAAGSSRIAAPDRSSGRARSGRACARPAQGAEVRSASLARPTSITGRAPGRGRGPRTAHASGRDAVRRGDDDIATISWRGMRSATAALVNPIRGRRSRRDLTEASPRSRPCAARRGSAQSTAAPGWSAGRWRDTTAVPSRTVQLTRSSRVSCPAGTLTSASSTRCS